MNRPHSNEGFVYADCKTSFDAGLAFSGERDRGLALVQRAMALNRRCEADSKPAHAKPAYAAPKILSASLSATRRW